MFHTLQLYLNIQLIIASTLSATEESLRLQEYLQDGDHNYVTVGAGVTVDELKEFELENNVNLPTNVIRSDVTYGGVVSPGCHVSTLRFITYLFALSKIFMIL